jgi:hypothetical protein
VRGVPPVRGERVAAAAGNAIAGGGPEDEARTVTKRLIAGRPWIAVGDVIRPTITLYSPKGRNSGAATVGLVRSRAAEWHIDPRKIDVIGFSARGHLVAAISTHFQKRLYPAVDRADEESCRPDFAILLYPGHLTAAATESRRSCTSISTADMHSDCGRPRSR